MCCGLHQSSLRAAACDHNAISMWCSGKVPANASFPGSRIITVPWADKLNEILTLIAPSVADRQWALCFSSFVDDVSTPSTFHRQCDSFNTTLFVLNNTLGYTFGGYVRCMFDRWLSCPV